MWSPFRKTHLKILLEISSKGKKSLDYQTHKYFSTNRSIGSKDRVLIKQGLYDIIKWKELLIASKARTADELVTLYTSESCPIGKDNSHLRSHAEVSFPKWLFKKLVDNMGYQNAKEFCKISNREAPTTIRINTLKCTINQFLETYKTELQLIQCKCSTNGIHVGKKVQFKSLPEFGKGYFEPQDEASQIICDIMQAKPGQQILDYCAGSGGKSLGFGANMLGKGQIHLHDVREKSLHDAKKRLKRAGIQNFQFYINNESRINKLIGKMDTVLVDAPCSCSGTFRRRPDQKWLLSEEKLTEFIELQREILKKSIPFIKVGGTLIYSTCSILQEENEDQTNLLKTYKNLTFIKSHKILLKDGQSDAMYFTQFKKNSLV